MSFHSVAKALLVNDQHQVLVLRIGEYKAHPEKSHQPDLPGGMVDEGESKLDAVIREIREEAGIVVPHGLLQPVHHQLFEEPTKSFEKDLFVAQLGYTPEVTISWEHEAYEWTDISELLDTHAFAPFYRDGIKLAIEKQLI